MKAFNFIQATISHNLKDPHSKALESDCLFPLLAVATQSPRGEWALFIPAAELRGIPANFKDEDRSTSKVDDFRLRYCIEGGFSKITRTGRPNLSYLPQYLLSSFCSGTQ
jgi:hypothetical protein